MDKLDKLVKSTNKSGYFRCPICNCVSNESIETNIGEYHQNSYFVNDPKDSLHFICDECDQAIQDIKKDFDYLDNLEKEEEVLLDGELG